MSESLTAAWRAYDEARERYRETGSREDDVAMLEAFYHWQELTAEAERLGAK